MRGKRGNIEYFVHPQLWAEYYNIIYQQLLPQQGIKRVCELGAGANPSLTPEVIKERKLDYWVTDGSEKELMACPENYQKRLLDVQHQSIYKALGQFDLIFSKMLVEHLPNPQVLHQNIIEALRPNAYAFHFFPTLGSLALWLNYLLPESLMRPLLMWAEPSRKIEKYGKFETYYKWCKGPNQNSITRFENLGYEVILYYGSYGHKYYEKIAPLHWLEGQKSKFLQKIKSPQFTANACILLRKK